MEPSLELTYNSFSTDVASVVGYGWSLSVPYIQVVNKTGVEDLYDSTFFTSSLSGELKPVSLTDSIHGTYGTKVETGAYLTYTFGTDGSWVVTDGEGRTYTFGSTSDSQVVDPSDTTRIYRWMLEETRDTNDNDVAFTYTRDGSQLYPSQIAYTGSGTTDGVFSVDFSYESRADEQVSYASGFSVTTSQRLSAISVVADGDTVHLYQLGYGAGDNGVRSMLTSVTQTGYDQDGAATTPPVTSFAYSASTLNWTEDSAYSIPSCFAKNEGYDCATRVSDVNGDALPDLLFAPGDPAATAYASLNDGDGTGWSADTSLTIPVRFMSNYVSAAQGVELFDVDGDGLDDLVHGESDDPYDSDSYPDRDVYVNDGDTTGWTIDSTFSLPLDFVKNEEPYTMSDKFVRLGDFNGDGLLDLISGGSPYDAYGTYYINNGDGTGWSESTDFSNGGPSFGTTSYTDGGVRLGDVNHDGLVDAVYAPLGSSAVYINDSDDMGSSASSYSVPSDAFFSYGGYDGGSRVVDVNGDGLVDLLVADDIYDTNAIYLNDGDGTGWSLASGTFPEEFNLYNLGANPYDRGVRLMDVDGDGLVDVVRYDDTSSSGGSAVYMHDGDVPDLLTSITTSQGAQIAITYVASSQTGENPELPFTVQVVQDITTSDGLAGSSTISYTYADGSFYFEDAQNREFVGFGTVTATDADGNVTTTYLHQGNGDTSASSESGDSGAKIGKVYREERSNSAGDVYRVQMFDWESVDLGDDRTFVSLEDELELLYDGGSTHADRASAYSYNSATGVTLTKTEYGEVSGNDDGSWSDTGDDDRTATTTYATDAAGVITARPATVTLTDTDGATVSQTRYTYDDLAFGSVETGNVTEQEVWISGTDYAATSFTYDTYGNVLTQTDPLGNTTTTTYDSYNLYPATVVNALSQTQTFVYDAAHGKPESVQEANGTTTETSHDGLGRPTEERRSSTSDAATLETTQTWSWDDSSSPRSITHRSYLTETTYQEEITYLDGLDRVIEVKTLDEDASGYNETETTYDALGRVATTTLPEASASSAYDASTVSSDLSEAYTYDALSRVTTVENVLGTTTTEYEGFTKIVTDAVGNQKDYETDGLGRLVSVVEYLDGTGNTTSYAWDAADHLVALEDGAGNVREFTFDGRGLRLTAEDLHDAADSTYGTWTYTYDDAGDLETSLSPNGVTVTYGYDELHRQTSEDASDETGVEVTLTYDSCTNGTGQRCETAVNGGAATSYAYDAAGNEASETVTLDGTNYTTSFTYDRAGNTLTTTYPDGTIVTNTYNALGKRETVEKQSTSDTTGADVVTDTDYGAHGEVTSQTNGNGTVTTYTYDEGSRYRLTHKVTTGYEADSASSTTTTTTTTNFYPTAGDGYAYKYNASWDTAHDATSSNGASYTTSQLTVGTARSTTNYYLYRTFLPFDTSAIPDDATITSATLNVFPYSKKNNDNDGDDFVTVVSTSQASTTTLTTADFDQAGSIDNPTEGIDTSERKDITNITTNTYLTFNLNSTGLGWISQTGTTQLGLREGHDVIDSAFTSSSTTSSRYNYLYLRSSEYSGTTYDPYLSVTYTQTSTSTTTTPVAATLQDLSYIYDDVGNITQIVDASDTDTAKTTDYTYDDLYRLESATVSAAADGNNGTITYAYDEIGNFTSRSDVGTYSYNETDDANPNAVTSLTQTDGTVVSYTYDNNGNLTSDGTTTYVWDYKNRLVSSGTSTTSTTTSTTITTSNFYPTAGDGYAYKYNASWDTAHDATSGSSASTASTTSILTGTSRSTTNYYLYRSFLPFDTSAIPDDATVTSASLNVYAYSKINHDNDGDDFITVVQTSQASATSLTATDFDQAGAINNPTEGIDTSERKDLTNITTGAYLTFNLNSTGLGWISQTDTTQLGLREGHDVIDSAFTSSSSSYSRYNYLSIRPGEYTGTTYDPYLSVTYTQSSTTTTTTTDGATYAYDHGMRRVSKTSDAGTVYYPGSDYSILDGTSTVSVSGPAGLTASIEYDGTTATTSTIHTDHLGSTSVVTDESGIMVELMDYDPYGTERISWSSSSTDGSAESQKTYIGEYSDDESGLSYLNARYYDPERGQFLSQDSMVMGLGADDKMNTLVLLLDPQSQNSYSYARNNAISQSDSSGQSWLTAAQGFGTSFVKGAAIGFALGVAVTATVVLAPAAATVVVGASIVAGAYGVVSTVNSVTATNNAYQSGAITADQRDYQYGSVAGGVTGGILGGYVGYGAVAGTVGAGIGESAVSGLKTGGKLSEIKYSNHAKLRMEQRGISTDMVRNTVDNNSPFDYYHDGAWKNGYHDSATKIFVGQSKENGQVTTVINNANQNYINNLKSK